MDGPAEKFGVPTYLALEAKFGISLVIWVFCAIASVVFLLAYFHPTNVV